MLRMTANTVVLLILACCWPARPAQAGPIDASAFGSVEHTEISFTQLPVDAGSPGARVIQGITFTSAANAFRTYPAGPPYPYGGPAIQVCAERGCIMTDVDLDTITASLPTPTAMVGAYVGIPNVATTAIAEFYAGSMLLGTLSVSALPFEGVFVGWDAGSAIITSVRFIDDDPQQFVLALTGFTFQDRIDIPVAPTLLLVLTGFLPASRGLRNLRRSMPARASRGG